MTRISVSYSNWSNSVTPGMCVLWTEAQRHRLSVKGFFTSAIWLLWKSLFCHLIFFLSFYFWVHAPVDFCNQRLILSTFINFCAVAKIQGGRRSARIALSQKHWLSSRQSDFRYWSLVFSLRGNLSPPAIQKYFRRVAYCGIDYFTLLELCSCVYCVCFLKLH